MNPPTSTIPEDELSIINLKRKTLPGPEYLHKLIKWPCTSADAINFWTSSGDIRRLSYKDLDEQTSALAERITEILGSAREQHADVIVPVLISQSPELYVSWIAVLKAGAAFCPVAIDAPAERLKFILKDVGATLVLTTHRHEQWLAEIAPEVHVLDVSRLTLDSSVHEHSTRGSDQFQCLNLEPESLAYIMYTSGSTGMPKGVKISHRAVSQALLAHDEHIPTFKRFLQFASPTFDVSVFETFFPFFRGTTLVSRDREQMLADLPGTIGTMNVDAAELTPTVAATLLKNRVAAPCLQLLLTIGEMLTTTVLKEFGDSDIRPGILYAMYGPTEASIHCTIATMINSSSSIHNVGQPLATVTTAIIASSGSDSEEKHIILPKGQIGELAIAGQLASGYLNRPEQTATAFIQLPGYGSFYRTGDRAQVSASGSLEVLGRLSSGQVKLRGQRLELGEIESIACRYPGVVMAVASIINDSLVLFCVQDGDQVSANDVRSVCKKYLLRFMVPSDIVILELEDLRRLPSGKIDRREIETNFLEHPTTVLDDHAEQLEPVTVKVCEIISDVLGRRISPTRLLWTEGMNSLMAIEVASALRAHHVEVSVLDILELETIMDIVARIHERHTEGKALSSPSTKPVEDTDAWRDIQLMVEASLGDGIDTDEFEHIMPCNAVQVAMLAETVNNEKLNFNYIELQAAPHITWARLHTAFQHLAQKNEILRSGFVSINNSSAAFAQVVWKQFETNQYPNLQRPLCVQPVGDESNRFIVQIHHALYDGWSWDLIMADLNHLLAEEAIPERPQFRLVSRKQRSVKYSQQQAAEDYWRARLAAASPCCVPQLSDKRTQRPEKHVLRRVLRIASHTLVDFARKTHISSQTVLSTAFSMLLGSYTGSSNVIFGFVLSGRHTPVAGIEDIIGPCLSTLPLSVDLSAVSNIRDLLLYVDRSQLELLEHNTLSLHDVLAITRTSAPQKLFDSLFVWQESIRSLMPSSQLIKVVDAKDRLDYSLVVEAEPRGNEIIIKLIYDTARLSQDHAECFLNQLEALTAILMAHGRLPLQDVWSASDFKDLAMANADMKPSKPSFDLVSSIKDLAMIDPKRTAISFAQDFNVETGAIQSEALTYAELWQLSNEMAHSLRNLGVGADDIVSVILDKSLDLYVLDLAIIIAGGAFLNVDIRTPSERTAQILREVKCRLVVSGDKYYFADALKGARDLVQPLAKLKAGAQQYHGQVFHSSQEIDGSNLAYAVMTSGTTGRPKAILVTRDNLHSNIEMLSNIYPRGSNDCRMLQACSTAFDVFVFEVFWTLHQGLCLCASPNDVLFRNIEGFICAAKVTHLSLTPSVAALIHPENVPDVKFLVTAGEPMNLKVFNDWAGRGLFQGYGPAETTNICNVKGPAQEDDLSNNVGPPIPNTSIYICAKRDAERPSHELCILPTGAYGEIVIGGSQVGRGYADHHLTGKSFIDTKHGKLYRSGDMGRLLANGDLLVLGREDDQVKLRGQRVELGDINTALLRLSFVVDAATFILGGDQKNDRLVSFWTGNNAVLPEHPTSTLYEMLEGSLLPYMIPDYCIPIEKMPLTRQGKIDKKTLGKHFADLDDAALQSHSRESTVSDAEVEFADAEKSIAEALLEVTNESPTKLKPNMSFFALGLDSISSVRFSQKLRQLGFGQVDVSTILRHCSVRRLCRELTGRMPILEEMLPVGITGELFDSAWRDKIEALVTSQGHMVEKFLPCTGLQESILSAQASSARVATYEAHVRFDILGDADKLQSAWRSVVKKYQILRTCFPITTSTEHAYAQVVLKEFELPWVSSCDLSSREQLEDILIPPWRLVFDGNPDGMAASLTLTISHALYDSEALALLLREVEQRYHECELKSASVPDLYIQYSQNLDLKGTDAFWQRQLDSYTPQSFGSLFRPGNGKNIDEPIQHTYTLISASHLQTLQAAAKEFSATPSILFQAAWARLLSCYTKDDDIVFGNVFSGRNLPLEGVTDIVAPLFNTLPLRIKLNGRQSMRDLVAKTQKATLDILPLQPSSLRRIVRNQHLNGRPLFDTMVLIQTGDLTLDEEIWVLQEEEGDMDFLGVIIEIVPDSKKQQFVFKLHVQSASIDSSTAQQILANYDAILDEILQYPQGQAADFTSVTSELPALYVGPLRDSKTTPPESVVDTMTDKNFTDLELGIRQLYSRFSGVVPAKIGKETTIFELGLDSLHVVQIASELRHIGHEVTGADVLEANTIDRLSKICELGTRQNEESKHHTFDLIAFDQEHRAEICEQFQIQSSDLLAVRPCTSTQSGILIEFIGSRGKLYFNSVVLELQPDADLQRLKNAWQIVMDRNEMLRTGFVALSQLDHPYTMVTYATGAQQLPWLVEDDVKTQESQKLAQLCLQDLHNPCWRLLLKKSSESMRLEIHQLHSLYDANSLDRMLSEVAALYQNGWLNLSNPIPVAPALRVVIDETNASNEASEDFWRDMGAGAQPFRFPNLSIHQHLAIDTVTVSKVCPSLLQDLNGSCRRLGVTLQSICQVAWARLLAAYTGESKVMFGIVLSGRIRPELVDVLFPTINTVPFCIQGRDSTTDMLSEASEINVGLFKHQYAPMTTIKRWLEVEGDCFDTILVLQNNRTSENKIAPWTIVKDRANAEYAISLEIVPENNGNLRIQITVRLETVPAEHAKIILTHFEAYLRQTIGEIGGNTKILGDLLSIVPAKDERISTEIELLHDLVEATTSKTPEAIALEFAYSIAVTNVEKQSWSYRQLTEESNRVAHLLISHGATTGQFVAVCFDKCPEASFAILGVLKAGCAYVAIDSSAPILRKSFILEDARCQILLTTKNLLFSMDNDKTMMLAVDDQNLLQGQPTTKPVLERRVLPSDTCYCLYTSGTTGQPKGCLISHNSAVQAMLSFQRIFAGHWDRDSRWLQFASFHFDVSVLEQYWSWSVGICVTSAPRDVLFEDIAGAIDVLQITHLDLTPSLARLLKPEQVPSLCRGVFIVGGEQITQDIIDTWGEVGCLYNFYGPSEVTIGCTVHKRVKKGVKATNIGQPWDNVGAFVLELGSERPVIRGAVGELCLSGPLVGRGYLNRPDLTAEKFVMLKEYRTRVYRSGDLVRLLHDDSFEFLGRIDDQVKLRGQRLEIREIDHAIKQAADIIADVVTIFVKDAQRSSEQLVAFFTIRGQSSKWGLKFVTSPVAEKLITQLRRRLQDSLPAYMVPTHFLQVSRIPLSANNKADLKALKTFFVATPIRSLQNMDWNGSSIEPSTETTRKVISSLAAFLRIPELTITPSSRLFELGLDSISVVAFSSVLRRKGFSGVDAATVMRRPVVADLAHELDAAGEDKYEKTVEEAKQDIQRFRQAHKEAISSSTDVESFWPCTSLQEDMLSKATNRGSEPYYLSAFHYVLGKNHTLKELMKAWTQAQLALPILRTIFFEVSKNRFGQIVRQYCLVPVRHRKLMAGEDVMAVLDQSAAEWRNNIKILDSEPAWEVEIVETSVGQYYMSLRIFHGLYDANSLSIMLNEVAKSIRNGDMEINQNTLGFHEALPYGPLGHREGAKDFWVKQILSTSLLELPPKPNAPDEASTTYSIVHDLPERFTKTRGDLGVTDSALFQAACLLSLHAKYDSFPSLGMVVSGRSFPVTGVEKICGPLFNTIPFQVSPNPDWSHADLVRACHDFNIGSKPFEHTSLKDIGDWIGLGPGKAFFDTLFVFQKETREASSANEDVWREVGQIATPDYPLNIEVRLMQSSYRLIIVADSQFLGGKDLYTLSASLSDALEQITANADGLINLDDKQMSVLKQVKPEDVTAPRKPVDTRLLQLVNSQIGLLAQLDTSEFDENVSVFSLGLDSISLIELSAALRKINLSISVNMLMRLSTPINIAQYLTARNVRPASSSQVDNDAADTFRKTQLELRNALQKQGISFNRIGHVWPVTPMQEGVLASFEKYYHFAVLKLSPDTDSNRLISAWKSAINLHPALRTRFVAINDPATKHIFAQLISNPQDHYFDEVHVDDPNQLPDLVFQHSNEMTKIGLAYPPLIVKLVAIKKSRTRYILLGMSHAIYDGWSIQLLHEDIARLYRGKEVNRPSIEPHLQYTTEYLVDEGNTFWKGQISDYETQPFPVLSTTQSPPPKSNRSVTASRTSGDQIRQFCKTHEVTAQILGLCIWTIVLSSYVQSPDVCFGVVLACRNGEDADQLMFPTFNTVPFRPHFDGGSYKDLLRCVHQLSLQIAEHQDFPLREIKKSRSESGELFDTLFVMQTRPSSDEVSKLYEEVCLGESLGLDYPINVEMDVGEKLNWTVAANGTLLNEDGLSDLIERLEDALETMMRDPDAVAMHKSIFQDIPDSSHTLSDSHAGDANRSLSLDTRNQDPVLRAAILEAISSVARCDITTLSDRTNIYSLGLDSISVIKVTGLLRKQGISLPVSKILAAVTLDKIVGEAKQMPLPRELGMSEKAVVSSEQKLPEGLHDYIASQGLSRKDVEDILPASAGQIFMLDFYQASRGRLFYTTFRYKVRSSLVSETQVRSAWKSVGEAFPALRTRFVAYEGATWQIVISAGVLLQHPPAAHITLSREREDHIVELQLHHALYDAVSFPITISALEKAFQGQSLPPMKNQPALQNFINATKPSDATARRHFWTAYLAEATSRDVLNTGSFKARRLEVVQHHAIPHIAHLASSAGLSLQALFLAAAGQAYAALLPSPLTKVVVGVYLANRGLDIPGLEKLAAPTVSVVPLVVDVSLSRAKSAAKIQRDLAILQRSENCGVTLREVYQWTGVRIEWFVNFVPRVRERGGDEDMYGNGGGGGGEQIVLTSYPLEKRDDDKERDRELTSPFIGRGLGTESEMLWCVPSVDVEVKLEDDGRLKIGVFAPGDKLDEDTLSGVLEEIREVLSSFR